MQHVRLRGIVWIMLAATIVVMLPQISAATTGGSCLKSSGYAISGAVKTSSGAAVNNVKVTLTGPGGCTNSTATSKGIYSFFWLAKGTYTVTPSKAGCAFSPVSRVVTISGSSVKANFTATCTP